MKRLIFETNINWMILFPVSLFLSCLVIVVTFSDIIQINNLYPYNFTILISLGFIAGLSGIFGMIRREFPSLLPSMNPFYGKTAFYAGFGVLLFSWGISSFFCFLFLFITTAQSYIN